MKPKIGVYLTSDVAKLLRLAARRSGATKSDIVNEAVARYLDPPPESDPNEAVLQRLDRLAKAIRRLHRDVEIMTETLAIHIRQFLMITPPVPKSEQQEAERLGCERYEVFVRQIARRVASDQGLITDVMRRIVETHPDLVAEAVAEARKRNAVADLFPANRQTVQPGEPVESHSHA